MRQPTVDCSHLTDVRRLTVNTCSQFNARPELCERSRVGTTPCKLTQSGTNATPTCHRDLQSKPCAHAGSLVASISRLFSTEARPHASLSLHTFFIETSSAWRTAEYCTTLRLNLAHDHVAKVSLVTTATEEEVHRRCAWFFGLVPQQHAPPPPPPPPPRPPPPPPPPPPPIIPFAYGTGSGRPSRRARRARRRAAAAKPEPPQTPLTAEQLGRLFVRRVGSLKSLTYATLLRHASDAIIGAPLLPRSSRAPAPVPKPLTQVVVHADVAVGEWGGMPASCACLLRARRVAFLISRQEPKRCLTPDASGARPPRRKKEVLKGDDISSGICQSRIFAPVSHDAVALFAPLPRKALPLFAFQPNQLGAENLLACRLHALGFALHNTCDEMPILHNHCSRSRSYASLRVDSTSDESASQIAASLSVQLGRAGSGNGTAATSCKLFKTHKRALQAICELHGWTEAAGDKWETADLGTLADWHTACDSQNSTWHIS